MNAQQMWDSYVQEENITAEYDAWAFGEDADALAVLVLRGMKTATTSAYPLYETDGEALPEEGEYSVILDSQNQAVCIIRTERVYTVPYCRVTECHAWREGEGDRSLDYWRKVHERFFRQCMEEAGLCFDENMKVVCEEFRKVYP